MTLRTGRNSCCDSAFTAGGRVCPRLRVLTDPGIRRQLRRFPATLVERVGALPWGS